MIKHQKVSKYYGPNCSRNRGVGFYMLQTKQIENSSDNRNKIMIPENSGKQFSSKINIVNENANIQHLMP